MSYTLQCTTCCPYLDVSTQIVLLRVGIGSDVLRTYTFLSESHLKSVDDDLHLDWCTRTLYSLD